MKPKISDQLRRMIDESGLSRYAICKQIGLDQSEMSRFMARKQGLSLTVIDKLCELLQVDLVARKESRR